MASMYPRFLIRELLIVALAMMFAACSALRPDFVKQPSSALPPVTDTPSTRYIASELMPHGDQSGFRLLTLGTNALMSRVALTDHAQRSIDMQYYIFKNDATGRLLAQRLLTAADRGVRIRMLLDNISISNADRMLDALDAHPNIQVRLFNPFNTRNPQILSKMGQFLLEGRRLNRRMHNKSIIFDNSVAIIGGRNIGNDYFNAGDETDFRDLDLLAIGPVVGQASKIFDAYWNSDAAIPVAAFRNTRDTQRDLTQLRVVLAHDARSFAQSDYAQASLHELPGGATADRRGEWFWGPAEVVADQPEKVDPASGDDAPWFRIGPTLKTMIEASKQEVLLVSPYFVPGDTGTRFLTSVAQRGENVVVLTNSLAATDEPVVHTGYARYRNRLLEGGVKLYELRPEPGAAQPATALGKSSGVSLHAKAMIIDSQHVFIGSLNMDPRSKLLNTEMGVIIDSQPLAQAVRQYFEKAILPENSFHVVLQTTPGGTRQMTWLWKQGDRLMSEHRDPGAARMRRFEVFALSLLPIEGLL